MSKRAIKWHYTRFNNRFFGGKLPKSKRIKIVFIRSYELWAAVENDDRQEFTIYFEKSLIDKGDKKKIFNLLLHEMVHIYQFIVYGKASHNHTFFKWKPKLIKNGYDLRTYYS